MTGAPTTRGQTSRAAAWRLTGRTFVNDPDLDGADLIGILAYLPWGWMPPLGLILMGWLLWRTKVVATWAAGPLALGGVLFVTGRPARIGAIVITTDVVLTVALVTIGMQILRQARPAVTSSGERVAA